MGPLLPAGRQPCGLDVPVVWPGAARPSGAPALGRGVRRTGAHPLFRRAARAVAVAPGDRTLSRVLATLSCHGAGAALAVVGKPIPRQSLFAAAALSVILLAGNLVTSRLLAPTNPQIVAALASGRSAYLDPVAMTEEIGHFMAIGVLWLLLVGPGLFGRFGPVSFALLAILGLWSAAAGTNLLTY